MADTPHRAGWIATQPWVASLPWIAAVAATTVAATWLGLQFYFGDGDVSSLWVANGIVLAALLASPRSLWPALVGVNLAALFTFDVAYHDAVHLGSVVNVGEALIGAGLVRRFGGPIGSTMSLRRALASFACVLLGAAPIGAALGTLTVLWSAPEADGLEVFRTWLFADGLGLVIVSPALHSIQARRFRLPDYEPQPPRHAEAWTFAGVFALLALAIFSIEPDPTRNLGDLHYALAPLLIWAAFRLEPWVSLSAVLSVACFAAWQTAAGMGPFVVAGQPIESRALSFQIPTLTTVMSTQILVVLANERRFAARIVEASTERFRNIVETTNEWIWELDRHLVCTYSSPHCRELNGFEPEEIVGMHLYDLIHPDDIPRFRRLLRDFVAVKAPVHNFAHRHRRKDGSIVHVETNAVPILDADGELLGYRGSHRDVTARVEAEAAERARRETNARADKLIALGTVVSGVAHEVNNPNQFIALNLPVLRRAWQDVEPAIEAYRATHPEWNLAGLPPEKAIAELADVIDEIGDGSDRIRSIITELRNYISGETSYASEPVNPNSLVQSAVRLLRGSTGARGQRIELDLEREAPAVLGNGPRLEQILVNLILNASDALESSAHERVIEISTGPVEPGNLYPIRVRDSGEGIEDADLERVLDPFFTTKREKGGTGLGLAISSRIAREHGGSLELDSRRGEGTTATLRIPVAG